MSKKQSIMDLGFLSGNRKSKIQNLKWAGILTVGATLAMCGAVAQAQQQAKKVPVVGVLLPQSAFDYVSYKEAFQQGLRGLGYVPGENILLEYRYAEGKESRYAELVAELVRQKVDVIVVASSSATRAVNRATSTIPIVVATAGDLVGSGLVASLAQPGGNITGSTNVDSDFSAKRLLLLKDSFPKLSRVAVLSWEVNQGDQDELTETRAAAMSLKVRIQSLEIKDPGQIPGAFAAITKERAGSLIITNNNNNFGNRRQIFELAAKNRLPTMCGRDAYVEAGGLMSYAADRLDSFWRAAIFVDKILQGRKPADLPVEQPMKFDFVVNLKTAKQIGVTIEPNVLVRANRVIR